MQIFKEGLGWKEKPLSFSALTGKGGMTRPFNPWSDVDTAKLIELWRAGASIKAIATRLGRTERAIVSRGQRLRDEDGADLALRNPAGAVPGWQTRRGLARAKG